MSPHQNHVVTVWSLLKWDILLSVVILFLRMIASGWVALFALVVIYFIVIVVNLWVHFYFYQTHLKVSHGLSSKNRILVNISRGVFILTFLLQMDFTDPNHMWITLTFYLGKPDIPWLNFGPAYELYPYLIDILLFLPLFFCWILLFMSAALGASWSKKIPQSNP